MPLFFNESAFVQAGKKVQREDEIASEDVARRLEMDREAIVPDGFVQVTLVFERIREGVAGVGVARIELNGSTGGGDALVELSQFAVDTREAIPRLRAIWARDQRTLAGIVCLLPSSLARQGDCEIVRRLDEARL